MTSISSRRCRRAAATAAVLFASLPAFAQETTHWSFREIRPTEDTTGDLSQLAETLDRFVAKRRQAAGLPGSPRADRRTLIRRLHLDVHGIPPTPEEINRFVADERTDAWHRLVDRVLANQHYGERWAQHWLDIVRYADTHGFEVNTPRTNAWPYRDWVIRSLNEDRSFDRFVMEQLAGDAMGEDAATGFLVAGPAVLPGQVGKDEPSIREARQDELDEIVKATGTTFLGLTIGCARCHDHKFDPVAQTDYYAMQAVFAGVRYGERKLPNTANERRAAALIPQLEQLRAKLLEFEPLARVETRPSSSLEPRLRRPVESRRNIERFAPVRAKFVRFTSFATNSNHEPCIDELEIYSRATTDRPAVNVALASAGATATSSGNYPEGNPRHKLAHINDGRYGNDHSWISDEKGRGWVRIELAETTEIDHIEWGRDREGRYADRTALRYAIDVAEHAGVEKELQWHPVASSEDRIPATDTRSSTNLFTHLSREDGDRARALQRQLEKLEATHTRIVQGERVYAGTFTSPPPTHRLHRGNPSAPREVVVPDAPRVFGTLNLTERAEEQQRRLALARWITSADNPLTARVIVNRIWQHHFGIGIVDTPSDFGHSGSKPTHPELLDWLAGTLVKADWSLKRIHRIILLSETYQQANAPRADCVAKDADNRLLWRFAPRRLEAEAIRDSMLAVSGTLDRKMGGPGFDLFVPNTNYVRVYEPKTEWLPDTWRRMVYAHKVRMEQGGVFGAFDCPDAGQAAPKRSRSTTPLQSLNLFNSSFVLQQASILARRIERNTESPAAQITRAFEFALGRPPSAAEKHGAMKLVTRHGLRALCRVLYNTNEFLVLP